MLDRHPVQLYGGRTGADRAMHRVALADTLDTSCLKAKRVGEDVMRRRHVLGY
jgi:hypothetical protein